MATQWDRILQVVKWERESDDKSERKFDWYRAHVGKGGK